MTRPGRFERRTEYARQDDVTSWFGVDTVTGLPVLIYDTSRAPDRAVEHLESEVIPGVLAASFDGESGELVAAFSTTYRMLSPMDIDDALVARTVAALEDAAAAGLVHGDIRPGRLLIAGGHVLVEGYGIPWSSHDERYVAPEGERTLAADVYAFARTFLSLARERLKRTTVEVLQAAIAANPADRPDAATLAAQLRRAAAAPATPVPGTEADPEPLVIDTDPGEALRVGGKAAAGTNGGRFSKEPPPGTKYISGEDADGALSGPIPFPSLHDGRLLGDGSRRWIRFAALGATLVLAAIMAFLALSRQGDRFGDPAATRAVVYVVDVSVEPDNLPPVTLVVVNGPSASKWQPGTALGTVPGRVVLDREGVWELQGVFQDRRSQVATLELPEQRSVRLTFQPGSVPDAP